MKRDERDRIDSLLLGFDARENPLARDENGLNPFLDALEAHAGEWMPDLVIDRQFGLGDRKHPYSRATVRQAVEENWDSYESSEWQTILMRRSLPPETEIRVTLWRRYTWQQPFHAVLEVWPISLFEDPAYALERSRRLIDLARAWGSRYPVMEGKAHGAADLTLSKYWEGRGFEPLKEPHRWLQAIFWLNIFGKEWVDGLGRARVLSTPAHLVEELPNGAVLLVTRPTVADWASEEGRRAQARALVHLKPELDFDTVMRSLRERSIALTPVESHFDPDLAPLFQRVVDRQIARERWTKVRELNAYRPPVVDEWLPARDAPPSDVPDPQAAVTQYEELAEGLVVIMHNEVPSVFKQTPESLTDVDFYFWDNSFPEVYPRSQIERHAVPAMGAYLGEVLVRNLGGRWVPRRKLDEAQVIVGDRAWLPFVRARRALRSVQALIDYSLTKLYREAERYQGGSRASA